MRIISICSNYGSNKDGIGNYSEKIVDELKIKNEIKVMTADITNYNKIQRFFSLAMSKEFLKTIKIVKQNHYDIVNIEYPFTEWNSIILLSYKRLYKKCKKLKIKICLSLHEYDRVNFLRKKVIEFMVKNSDIVLVSSKEIKNKLIKINKNIFIRDIPSNIIPKEKINLELKNKNIYVFFGLINKSKAFDEMISGWKKAYEKFNNNRLIIITSSDVDIKEESGIDIKRNLEDKEIIEIMKEATYAFLPIKPSVGYNNATLKTATLCGVIPIGCFSEELQNDVEDFSYSLKNYKENSFCEIIKEIQEDNRDISVMQLSAMRFGEKYNVKNIVEKILNIYRKNMEE